MDKIDRQRNNSLKVQFKTKIIIPILPFAKEGVVNTHMHYIIQTAENILPGLFRLHTCLCLMLFQSLKKKEKEELNLDIGNREQTKQT